MEAWVHSQELKHNQDTWLLLPPTEYKFDGKMVITLSVPEPGQIQQLHRKSVADDFSHSDVHLHSTLHAAMSNLG